MKISLLITIVVTGVALNFNAKSAPVASGGGGSVGTVAPVAPVAQPGANPSGRILLNPNQQNQEMQGQQGINTSFNSNAANQYTATNQFARNTNGTPGTNNFSANSNTTQSTAVNGNLAFRDRALTASDQALLGSLRQGLAAQLGTTTVAQTPVHFLIDNGRVTIVGTVATADESQRILARVQQTPGVVNAFNDLHVGTTANPLQPTGANRSSLTGTALTSDHAFSARDQALLSQVQQEAAMQLGITGASASQMPVHFSIQNGIVGVTGQVSSQQEKQALLGAIQRTTGVNRVVDNVIVTPSVNNANMAPAPLNPEIQNGMMPAASQNMAHTNNFMLNTTNSSGF